MPSVERLLSSYDFIFGGGLTNSYFFETRNGVVYEVKFKPSGYIFDGYPDFCDKTFEFVIDLAETPVNQRIVADELIKRDLLLYYHRLTDAMRNGSAADAAIVR